MCLSAIEIATAQPPQRPPQPIIIMIIALTGILFSLLYFFNFFGNFIVAFFTFDKCQDNGCYEAESDNAPTVNADVAHGIAAVTVDDGIFDVKDDHDAETENGNDFKSVDPPFANAEIGKFVCFLTEFFRAEEPADQYDFEETGGGNTDVIDEVVNDIEDVETGTGDEEEADNERRYQYDGNSFFMACLEFILEAGNNSLENGNFRSDTGGKQCAEEADAKERIETGQGADGGGEGHECKTNTGTGNVGYGNTLLECHVTHDGEYADAGKNFKTMVGSGSDESSVNNVGFLRQIAGVTDHDGKADG